MFFNKVGANSASNKTKFSKLIDIDVKKKDVPTPTNKSLEKNPQKNTSKS
jgi:hypothetical protein